MIEPESRARKVMMTQTTVDNVIGIYLHAFYIPRTHLFSSRFRGAYPPFYMCIPIHKQHMDQHFKNQLNTHL